MGIQWSLQRRPWEPRSWNHAAKQAAGRVLTPETTGATACRSPSLNFGVTCPSAIDNQYTNRLLCEPKTVIITIKHLCRRGGRGCPPRATVTGSGGLPRGNAEEGRRVPQRTPTSHQPLPRGLAQTVPGRGAPAPLSASPKAIAAPFSSAGKASCGSPPRGFCDKVYLLTQNAFLLQKPCSHRRNPLCFQNVASAVSFKNSSRKSIDFFVLSCVGFPPREPGPCSTGRGRRATRKLRKR